MSNRSTIIFGNGLGMALDPNYFNLKAALSNVWNSSKAISKKQKSLIKSALPNFGDDSYPESEEMLDNIHLAIDAAEFLKRFEKPEVEWLNDNSREISKAFKTYIHEVGMYFHRSNKELPQEFINELAKYINQTKSHVAVLNYDNLIYDAFCHKKVLDGYYGPLIDGFLSTGFSPTYLDRFNISKHGWYLHLHGSPLFVGNNKATGYARDFLTPDDQSHIVLSHIKHKPSLIYRSNILSEYWERLAKAIGESDCLIVFGYSGLDTHLNEIIKINSSGKKIHVVEWIGEDENPNRLKYWSELFNCSNLSLTHSENILDFKNWHFNIQSDPNISEEDYIF